MIRDTDRVQAQLYTLEGLAAAVVMLLALTYALNAFVLTPESNLNPGTDTNQQVAEDLLAVAEENNELKGLLLNWNATEGAVEFENSTEGVYYYEGENPNPDDLSFGKDVEGVLSDEGLSYNIKAFFSSRDGSRGSLTIVENGKPGTSAVSASRTVILLDSDNVTDTSQPDNKVELNETDRYPIPKDPERETNVYNQATVRITVW